MGFLLLIFSFLIGYCLIREFTNLDKPGAVFSGAFLAGTLISGIVLYLPDLALHNRLHWLSFGGYFGAGMIYLIFSGRRLRLPEKLKEDILDFCRDRWLVAFFIPVFALAVWLNYHTLSTSDGNITVFGAWGDIILHNSFIRSISAGNVLPPEYPYYVGVPATHYHFMFDYFGAKVAELGLNPVHAGNWMSILSLTVLLVLIFEFGRWYFKSVLAGFLGGLFLIFQSSLAGINWFFRNLDASILSKIFLNVDYMAEAPFEDWGLFSLNVFVNQRHVAFGFACLALVVYLILKYREDCKEKTEAPFELRWPHLKKPLFLGLLIGILPFWHTVITAVCLVLLGFFALTGIKNRQFFLSMVITGLVAGLVSLPQFLLFNTGYYSPFHGFPVVHFGYGADPPPTFPGILIYYWRVLGVKLLLLFLAVFIVSRLKKIDLLILLIPFVIANLFQFSPILYDNNKLLFCSLIFINCYTAFGVGWILKKLPVISKSVVAVILIGALSMAGIIDWFSYKNASYPVIPDKSSPLVQWILKNTKPNTVFLTERVIPYGNNAIVKVLLAGRKLYMVDNNDYFVEERERNHRYNIITEIFAAKESPESIKALLKKEGIQYMVVEYTVRERKDYQFNEAFFRENFQVKYQDSEAIVYSAL
ncbi:MAG TPA: hypothetical protein VHY08_24235 [Bacillota bacterium]|nr:hypothetical protein [Bacillota bacterium]